MNDSAQEKAWQLVKDMLQNNEQYLALRQGFHIILVGSNKKQYVLYPSGRVVRLDKNDATLGKMQFTGEYVNPDYLATIIAWIRFNADELEKDWACGSLTIQNRTDVENDEEDIEVIRRRVMTHNYGPSITSLVIPIITIGVMLVVGLGIMGNLQSVTSEMSIASVENATSISPFKNIEGAFNLPVILPIIVASGFIIFIILTVTSVDRR